MGFEQDALQEMHDAVHSGKSAMWHQVESAGKGEPFVLRQLLKHGTQTPSRLAEALHASSGRVSALLGSLEKKGYITRRIDESDRRNILVSLTEEGARQARQHKDEIDSVVRWIFSQMGERRTREFVGLSREFMTYMSMCLPGEPRPTPEQIEQAFAERAKEAKDSEASARAGGSTWAGESGLTGESEQTEKSASVGGAKRAHGAKRAGEFERIGGPGRAKEPARPNGSEPVEVSK